MAQSSVPIRRENNYDHDFPSKQPAYPSDHTPTKEVKRELSPVPTVQVCPINVIQGDSILVMLTYKEGTGAFWFIIIFLVHNSFWEGEGGMLHTNILIAGFFATGFS